MDTTLDMRLVKVVNPHLAPVLYGACRARDVPAVLADARQQGATATELDWQLLPVRDRVPVEDFAIVGPFAPGLRRLMTVGIAEGGRWALWWLPGEPPPVPALQED